MKIVITGSLGHISKPLTIELLQNGHNVIVISSDQKKQKDIETLGAKAAIGSLEDIDFLVASFADADAVYCMIPPNNYFNHDLNLLAYYQTVAANYFIAIETANIKRVVYLSSVGAHLKQGSGILIGHHAGEAIMSRLPNDVAITFMRPVGFYYNLLGFVNVIKQKGLIEANYGAEEQLLWVSPIDIASAVVEELISLVAGTKIRYVVSDELSGNETARILGEAIGKPDLKWKLILSEQWLQNLKAIGMNPTIASGFIEMFESQHNGLLTEDYYLNNPTSFGKVKLKDFAFDFAKVYYSQ